jgi:hypothetical protein
MPSKFWLQVLKEMYHFRHAGMDDRLIIKWVLRKQNMKITGFIWLRVGTSGEFL